MELISILTVTALAFVVAARRAGREPPLWIASPGVWDPATVVRLVASLLLAGSVVGDPALADAPNGAPGTPPRGVLAITRHPMMWAFTHRSWSMPGSGVRRPT